MKLNYKKIIYIGLAFFLIQMFWQTYDTIIAKILIDKFGLNQTWSGVVMALDNVLALILLPIFGGLSDRSNHKKGKRTPFIFIGTIIAAISFIGLAGVDHWQTGIVNKITIADNVEMVKWYEDNENATNKGTYEYWNTILDTIDSEDVSVVLSTKDYEKYQTERADVTLIVTKLKDGEKLKLTETNALSEFYHGFLSIQTRAQSKNNSTVLILFVIVLLITLVAMSIFRSPAVALTPDVVIKPLRSRANAVVNLMGSAGGIVAMVILMVFNLSKNSFVNYMGGFISVSVIMIICLVVFMLTVKEPKWVEERVQSEKELGLTEEHEASSSKLSKGKLISLILILSSVFLWYMGYNAVISKVSDYAPKVLEMDFGFSLIIAQAAAIISYIPIGILSAKIGRKKTILAGVLLLVFAFGSVFFLTPSTGWVSYIIFSLIGIAWATINVNSYPMVVELSKGSDVGKYTGYYYMFSMAAQIITPIFSGFLIDSIDRTILFPYAAIFVALSFITMLFVKHGDSEGKIKKDSLLESFDVED